MAKYICFCVWKGVAGDKRPVSVKDDGKFYMNTIYKRDLSHATDLTPEQEIELHKIVEDTNKKQGSRDNYLVVERVFDHE